MHIVTKDTNLHHEVLDMAKSLYKFMQNKYKFTCEPKVKFVSDDQNAKDILCKTGHYDPDAEEIVIYITNRHGKDILRSFAHELLHHIQGCEGMIKGDQVSGTKDPNYILHDKFLKHIEADAFERGNICFREWEAHIKEGDKMLDEKKKKLPKAKLKLAHKKAKKALKKGGFEKYGSRAEEVAYATMTKQATNEESGESYEDSGLEKPELADRNKDNKIQRWEKVVAKKIEKNLKEGKDGEVEVNEALKNSLYYVKEDRPMSDAYQSRDEKIYNELLKKFKIKK